MSTTMQATTCQQCNRPIIDDGGVWVDPAATGDDSIWRETCDASETFTAEHVPTYTPTDATSPTGGPFTAAELVAVLATFPPDSVPAIAVDEHGFMPVRLVSADYNDPRDVTPGVPVANPVLVADMDYA